MPSRWNGEVSTEQQYNVKLATNLLIPKKGIGIIAQASFSWVCKICEIESLHIKSIKHRLITKLITEFICKLRDESNEPN